MVFVTVVPHSFCCGSSSAGEFLVVLCNCLLFIVLFAIGKCTKQNKSNYLNSHGEEAQEKPPGL